MLIIDSSSSLRFVDWHISNNFKIFFTLNAVSTVEEIVALISLYPKSPRGNIIYMEKGCIRAKKLYLNLFFVYLI